MSASRAARAAHPQGSDKGRAGRLLGALLLCSALLSAPLRADNVQDGDAGRTLYLEVFVNDQPKHLITRFTDLGNGILSADAQELRNSGILPDTAATKGEIRLDQIPGLGWRLIEPEQTIRFIVPEDLIAPHQLNAGETDDDLFHEDTTPTVDHGYGLVLNYSLNADRWKPKGGKAEQSVSGSFDSRLFMPLGAMTHGFAVTQEHDDYRMRRLDSYWRSSFPGRMTQIQLGDLGTRGPTWARPVRLGGAMIERNFGLRPDLVTLPLPGFRGSAALPSTVEVFTDSIRTYSAEIPEGPFQIDDLPIAGGGGMARVVVRDITGRETQIDLPFFVSDDLLRPGMADFALAYGRPRLGFGTDNDHYAPDHFGVATLRLGLTDGLTMMAHAEGGPDLAMAGLGATFRLAHLGTGSVSLAHSRAGADGRDRGSLIDVSTRLTFGRAQVRARVQKTRGTFTDIAARTAEPDLIDPSDPDMPRPDLNSFPSHLAQFSFSTPLSTDTRSGAGLFISDMRLDDDWHETSIGASYNRQVGASSHLTLTAVAQRGREKDTVLGAQLYVPLGRYRDISLSTERRGDSARQQITASGRSESRVPGWSWRLQAERGEQLNLAGSALLDAKLGSAEIAARSSDGARGIGLRLDGSIVAAGAVSFCRAASAMPLPWSMSARRGSRSAPKTAPSAAPADPARSWSPICAPTRTTPCRSTRSICPSTP